MEDEKFDFLAAFNELKPEHKYGVIRLILAFKYKYKEEIERILKKIKAVKNEENNKN